MRSPSAKSPDAVDALVGRNIRFQRLMKRMSQTALGKRLGITFQQVQKYEKGRNRVSVGRLVRIAEIFGLPVTTLLDGVGSLDRRTGAPTAAQLIAERQPLRLILAFSQIDDARFRRALVALVEEFARRLQRKPGKRSRRPLRHASPDL